MLHEAQILARSDLYTASARQAFERANMRAHGIPELPAQPGDGSTICKTRDRCHWEYEQVEGGWNCTWVLDPAAEHCETCLERAEEWNPLFVAVD